MLVVEWKLARVLTAVNLVGNEGRDGQIDMGRSRTPPGPAALSSPGQVAALGPAPPRPAELLLLSARLPLITHSAQCSQEWAASARLLREDETSTTRRRGVPVRRTGRLQGPNSLFFFYFPPFSFAVSVVAATSSPGLPRSPSPFAPPPLCLRPLSPSSPSSPLSPCHPPVHHPGKPPRLQALSPGRSWMFWKEIHLTGNKVCHAYSPPTVSLRKFAAKRLHCSKAFSNPSLPP